MATVKIDKFGGIAPRQHPTQLADGMAITAHNVKLKTGKLVPLRKPSLMTGASLIFGEGINKVSQAQSIHIWRDRKSDFDFLLFGGMTWVAEGNIADDEKTRILVSGDRNGDGEVDEPVLYMRDAVNGSLIVHPICKKKLDAPRVSRTDGSLALDDNRRYTRFFITWVDKQGYESPVSSPSLSMDAEKRYVDEDLEYMDGDTISFEKIEDLPPEADRVRVYKVITGTEEGRIQFIKEFVANKSIFEYGFAVKVKDENAGELIPEIESPPEDLHCISAIAGDFYCGISKKYSRTVFFSDVGLLYSWPIAYRYDVKDNLVAVVTTGNTVFALTDSSAYILTGTVPESMTVTKLADSAACVSQKGVCVYRNAVYFASNAGLMTIISSSSSGTICENLTDKIFTKEQWQSFNPSSCVMGQFDGCLFLFFRKENGDRVGLSIDLLENGSVAVTTHDEVAKCLCVDNVTDDMYFIRVED